MSEPGYLSNQFLIAMPNLRDPQFFHSVTYICEHNEQGAMGIVINQPVGMTVAELVEHVGEVPMQHAQGTRSVFRGGPVEGERGFVLHAPVGEWESTLPVADGLGVTTSSDIIHAMAKGQGPEKSLVVLGYAGWGAGQLESEIRDNSWLNGPADHAILFETPAEKRWTAAAALIGVDIRQLSGDAGHA
ncbi:MAG: YqgE/AlgH family protein [Gammaproteobacteria bacterium]|nr:YqgE/AlgH family protein [Gammaproteobacteria bacterium]